MDWNELNGYDERYAKKTIRAHKTFDGKVIEVLYGAKDAEGNPVPARQCGEDGAGRWFGIETVYGTKMFSLTKPASEGGETEYGTAHGEQALEDMENDLRAKLELCREAERIAREADDSAESEMTEIKAKFDAMEDWGTPKDADYLRRMNNAASAFNDVLEQIRINKDEKQRLIDEAEKLAESTDWKKTNRAFRDLQDAWNEIDDAGAEDRDMRKKFESFRKSFDEKRTNYFAHLDEAHAASEAKKNELIEKTKAALAEVKNWKAASDKMNQFMNDWKAAGSSGKEKDDELWAQFKALRDEFYQKRSEFYDARTEGFRKAAEAKKAIIAEAAAILEKKDFAKAATDAMRNLDVRWKEAGYAGKDSNDSLWDEFKAVKNKFWDAKHVNMQEFFKETIARKQAQINEVRAEINALEEQQFETEDFTKIRGLQRRAEEKKDLIARLQQDITDLNGKLDNKE